MNKLFHSLLVLGSPDLLPGSTPGEAWGMFGGDYAMTWAFVLEPIGDVATRLVVRVRGRLRSGIRSALVRGTVPTIHGIMERAQLRHLKQRAESATAR